MPDRTSAMVCPVDGTALVMSERQNIEIDYCPACRGVWLDRGELDKIIERSTETAPPPPPPQASSYQADPRAADPWQDQSRGPDHGRHQYPKRRKSFLQELFD